MFNWSYEWSIGSTRRAHPSYRAWRDILNVTLRLPNRVAETNVRVNDLFYLFSMAFLNTSIASNPFHMFPRERALWQGQGRRISLPTGFLISAVRLQLQINLEMVFTLTQSNICDVHGSNLVSQILHALFDGWFSPSGTFSGSPFNSHIHVWLGCCCLLHLLIH